MWKNCRLDNRGFSLLEVIVALAIMGIGFITVLNLFSEGIRSLDFTDQYLKGVTLANNKLGELELSDFNVNVFSGYFPGEEKYRWELALTPYESPLNSGIDRIFLMQVKLKVLWNEIMGERGVELVTLKMQGKNRLSTDVELGKTLVANQSTSIVGAISGAGTGMISSLVSGARTDTPPPPTMCDICGAAIPCVIPKISGR